MSSERYLIDFPSDKMLVEQKLGAATELAELTFDGELDDSRAINLPALFAAYLTRYSNLTETTFRLRSGDVWDVEAYRVDTALTLAAVEEIELPEAAEPDDRGLALGLCTETIEKEALLEANLDFALLIEQGAQTRLRCYYSQEHFDADGIRFRLHAFAAMLGDFLENPDRVLAELSLSSKLDAEMLAKLNNVTMEYDDSTVIHQRFETQVSKTPDAEAVCFNGRSLSYRQLDHRSNQFAHYLRSKGADCGVKIGLFIERSEEMIVAMLGILKTGAAYIPLDPSYPADRIAYIAEDSCVPIIVTQKSLLAHLDTEKTLAVLIDDIDSELQGNPTTKIQAEVQAEDPIYLIYTSGSTGKPKGVQITHRNGSNSRWVDVANSTLKSRLSLNDINLDKF